MTRGTPRRSKHGPRAAGALADLFDRVELRAIQRALLRWFTVAQRDLPWRVKRDAYSTWVSEVMLQQTQVATVVPYFERWMRTYPTVAALSQAREQDVLKLWEGLGYYSRARSLLAGARVIREKFDGQVPPDVTALRSIPGVGRYTAGAIASIGYGKPAAILDGNVMRVLCRLRDLEGDPRKGALNELLWTLAGQLVIDTRPAQLNESLMELGATVCTPARPRCGECPVRLHCAALANASVDRRPSLVRRAATTDHRVMIAVVSRNRRVLVERQAADAPRWAGLWTFPHWECAEFDAPEHELLQWLAHGPSAQRAAGVLEHTPHESLTHEHGSNLAAKTPKGRGGRKRETSDAPKGRGGRRRETSGATVVGVLLRGKYSITRFRFSFVAVQALVPRAAQLHTRSDRYSWVTREQLLRLPMPAPHRRVAQELG